MNDTGYLKACKTLAIQICSICAQGIFFSRFDVVARFQQSCNLEAALQIFWNSIGSLSQTAYCAQLTKYITKYKHPTFFLLNSLKNLT